MSLESGGDFDLLLSESKRLGLLQESRPASTPKAVGKQKGISGPHQVIYVVCPERILMLIIVKEIILLKRYIHTLEKKRQMSRLEALKVWTALYYRLDSHRISHLDM